MKCKNLSNLSKDEDDTERGENDDEEREKETNHKQKQIVAQMFFVLPCWCTAEYKSNEN